MAETSRDTLIHVLERDLMEMKRRKGPHSIIATTLQDALQSGTPLDLRAGVFAADYFFQHYEQLPLEECRKRVQKKIERARELEAKRQEEIEKAKEQETKFKEIENRESERVKAQPQNAFWDWGLSDGIDFSRRDSLSTGKKRHLIAKAPRLKKHPKANAPRPKRK